MTTTKIAISIDSELLERLDAMVDKRRFSSRSCAVQEAIRDKLDRLDHRRLARECAKLDAKAEQHLAEEAFAADLEQWPEY